MTRDAQGERGRLSAVQDRELPATFSKGSDTLKRPVGAFRLMRVIGSAHTGQRPRLPAEANQAAGAYGARQQPQHRPWKGGWGCGRGVGVDMW